MAIIEIKNLNFKYMLGQDNVLNNINLTVEKGDFVLICGKSGCGKTTLIKHLKKELIPFGISEGKTLFNNNPIKKMDKKNSAKNIGYIMQNPDNQLVTNKVWHEIAFGLENLGEEKNVIKCKVAEISNYFGINNLFHQDCEMLSGGQKQIISLASILTLEPDVLILDEPTSQLDPIMATEFINILKKINDEFSITIIIVEHRLEEIFKCINKLVVMENGNIVACDKPKKCILNIYQKNKHHYFLESLPTPIKIALGLNHLDNLPLTIKEGRLFLEKYFNDKKGNHCAFVEKTLSDDIMEIKDLYFRYDKNSNDILKKINLRIKKNEFLAIVGANGAGKTTLANCLCGELKYYRGKILFDNHKITKNDYRYFGYLPQNPLLMFSKDSVKEEVFTNNNDVKLVEELLNEFELKNFLDSHPFDLSGGQQQKLALIKILLNEPQVIILDEPTKGIDFFTKTQLAIMLKNLCKKGLTIIMISHDLEFVARYCDECALLFDREIIIKQSTHNFFKKNSFYTTAARKLSKNFFENTILSEEVLCLCQKK